MNFWSVVPETLLNALLWLLSFLPIIILFSIVIFFHELGHFLMAKLVGVRVQRFAVGFGYRLFGWRKREGLTFGRMRQYPEGASPPRLGETDYCVNLLPLGGYVKMLGQMDFEEDEDGKPKGPPDPRSFEGKSVGQRALVICGGVAGNILFSLLLFMVIYLVGLDVVPPIVGDVMPGSPAERAGLLSGDRILAINGEKLDDFQDLMFGVALSPGGRPSTFLVQRDGRQIELQGLPEKIFKSAELRQMGIGAPLDVVLVRDEWVNPEVNQDQLRKGDRIVHVHYVEADTNQQVDKPVKFFGDVSLAFLKARGSQVEITAERKITLPDGRTENKTVTVQRYGALQLAPVLPEKDSALAIGTEKAHVLGLLPRAQVVIFSPEDSPAYQAGFRTGDVVIRAGDIANPTYDQIENYLMNHEGQMAGFTVLRNGRETPELQIRARVNMSERMMTKMGWDLRHFADDETTALIAKVIPKYAKPLPAAATQPARETQAVSSLPAPASAPSKNMQIPTPASEAGLSDGCVIQTVNGKPVANWRELAGALLSAGSFDGPRQIEIAYKTPEGGSKTAKMTLPAMITREQAIANAIEFQPIGWNNQINFVKIYDVMFIRERLHRSNPLEAMELGAFKTYQNIRRQFDMFKAMASQEVSMKQVRGPLGIIDAGRQVAFLSWQETCFFLAILSIGLAFFNFLPIPLLDGGHLAFLIYEKIAGKAAPINFRIWVTLISLALILICGAFVTVNDILRWFK